MAVGRLSEAELIGYLPCRKSSRWGRSLGAQKAVLSRRIFVTATEETVAPVMASICQLAVFSPCLTDSIGCRTAVESAVSSTDELARGVVAGVDDPGAFRSLRVGGKDLEAQTLLEPEGGARFRRRQHLEDRSAQRLRPVPGDDRLGPLEGEHDQNAAGEADAEGRRAIPAIEQLLHARSTAALKLPNPTPNTPARG